MLLKTVLLALVASTFASSVAHLEPLYPRDTDPDSFQALNARSTVRELDLRHQHVARDLDYVNTIIAREASGELEARGVSKIMDQAKYYLGKMKKSSKPALQRTGARRGEGAKSTNFRPRRPAKSDVTLPQDDSSSARNSGPAEPPKVVPAPNTGTPERKTSKFREDLMGSDLGFH